MTFQYANSSSCCLLPGEQAGRCGNLVENPSFEADLAFWTTAGDIVTDGSLPFEGTQVAGLPAGVASLFQDVSLQGTGGKPLFFSFNAVGVDPPDLTVEILWLNSQHLTIGLGLRMIIPRDAVTDDGNTRVTFFGMTDVPPVGAAFARVLFSKGGIPPEGTLFIDQVILAPVNGINLVKNHSFELGLVSWVSGVFQPNFEGTLQGFGDAAAADAGGNMVQEVSLAGQPPNSSYLFSFGAYAEGVAGLTAVIEWFDQENNPLGPPALIIHTEPQTLPAQVNYLTYLALTPPSPPGAATARIVFETVLGAESTIKIDQVLLARAGTANLVLNPSFENGAENWNFIFGDAVTDPASYEGDFVARLDSAGDAVFQDVPLVNAPGRCFLLNYGFKVLRAASGGTRGMVEARVVWLNSRGEEIGVGLSLLSTGVANPGATAPQWLVYTGITEPAPPGTAAARIQFTKPLGFGEPSIIHLDKVVFGSLI